MPITFLYQNLLYIDFIHKHQNTNETYQCYLPVLTKEIHHSTNATVKYRQKPGSILLPKVYKNSKVFEQKGDLLNFKAYIDPMALLSQAEPS